jgi:hypothetical protein
MTVITSSTWHEERLYVLRTLEDLKAEQKKQAEVTAADRASLIDRGKRDIDAAHEKIRLLEQEALSLKWKTWVMGALLGVFGAGCLEFVKAMLHGWKP